MTTKASVVIVDRDSALAYMKEVGLPTPTITADMEAQDGKVRLQIYQKTGTISAIRSSVGYMFKLARVDQPEKLQKEMSVFVNGMKRNEKAAKQHLGLKISEGKEPLTLEAYEFLAKKMFYSGNKKDIFAHLFYVLDWCLMKRAENVVGAKINHIKFIDDCLVFEFAKSKGNQTGEPHGPWHVYANPLKPWICPVLSLARYLLCYPDVLRGDVPLFEGTNQYARYSARFMQLINEPETKKDLNELGFEPEDLGTHSARKGVGTMVAAGCTVSPPIVSFCLRAGWSLGGVKDKYLFRANGGDQNVGRAASCLPQDQKEFAISPAYFDYTELEAEEKVSRKRQIKDFLESRLPNVDSISSKAWKLANYCFASICFHYEHLNENLHEQCPLKATALFKDIPDEIISLAAVKYPWNETEDTPHLTGIPPHTWQLARLERMEKKMDGMRDDIVEEITAQMEKRGFSSTQYKTSEITGAIETAVQSAMQTVMNKIDTLGISNVNPTSQANDSPDEYDFSEGFALAEEDEEDNAFIDATVLGEDNVAATEATEEERQLARVRARQRAANRVGSRKLKVGLVKGKLNPLPATWKPTSMTCPQLIQNWFLSNARDNIPPLYSLDSKMVEHLKLNNYRNSMKCFMKIVEKMARENDCWIDKPSMWEHRSINRMWETIREEFTAKYCQSKRKKEMTWKTAYNNMSKANAFGNKRNKANKE